MLHLCPLRAGAPCLVFALLLGAAPAVALADADQAPRRQTRPRSACSRSAVPIPQATPAPGESSVFQRADGAYQAVPTGRGRVKTFHIVERAAPWTLKPGLTVMANTYNGVVPGPALVVDKAIRVVLDYRNDGATPDSIHLHGVHDIPVTMDGVGGISQPLVPPGGHFVYRFVADQPGTFIYHTHDDEAMLDSGLYGAIIVEPVCAAPDRARPRTRLSRDDFVVADPERRREPLHAQRQGISATRELDVRSGERFRIRWINISGEEFHTMHTHGHYQQIVARDAAPVDYRDVEDTVLVAPGQRVDVVVDANAKPGTWLIHCHVMDHIEDASGMPAGLITAIHYVGTPEHADLDVPRDGAGGRQRRRTR